MNWDELRSYHESSRLLTFEDVSGETIYIPKTALSSSEVGELRSFIHTRVHATASKLYSG